MAKLCPVCDTQIKGTFCRVCKKFVKPVTFKEDIHLNTRHDDHDPDCDYHGLTASQDKLYHGTDADTCDTRTTNTYKNTYNRTYKKPYEKPKSTPLQKAVLVIVLVLFTLPYIGTAIVLIFDIPFLDSKSNSSMITSKAIVETTTQSVEQKETEIHKETENSQNLEEDSKQEAVDKLREENRLKYKIDDSGIRYVTEEEIMEEGLISNSYKLMDCDIERLSDIAKSVMGTYSYLGLSLDDGTDYDQMSYCLILQEDGNVSIYCENSRNFMIYNKEGNVVACIFLYYDLYTSKITTIGIYDNDEGSISLGMLSEISIKIMEKLGVTLRRENFTYPNNYYSYSETDGYFIATIRKDEQYRVEIGRACD